MRNLDEFYAGYCCCLSAALYQDDGTSTAYLEAVAAVHPHGLLAFAKRTGDLELPKIRRAVRYLAARRSFKNAARAS